MNEHLNLSSLPYQTVIKLYQIGILAQIDEAQVSKGNDLQIFVSYLQVTEWYLMIPVSRLSSAAGFLQWAVTRFANSAPSIKILALSPVTSVMSVTRNDVMSMSHDCLMYRFVTQLRHFIFNTTTTVTGVTYNGFHVISLKHIETISKSVPHHKDSQRDTTPLNIFFNTIKYPRIGHNWYAKALRMFLNRLILKPRAPGSAKLSHIYRIYLMDLLHLWYISDSLIHTSVPLVPLVSGEVELCLGRGAIEGPGMLHAASTVTRPETKRKKRDVQ